MTKIAEQNALEEYPILFSERNGYHNTFKDRRESYIKGYDQAMKDFLEKAMKYLRKNLLVSDLEHRKYLCMTEKNKNNFIRDFKNYMQDEK